MKSISFAKSAVAAAMAALAIGANAQSISTDMGVIDPGYRYSDQALKMMPGLFTDIWSFSIEETQYSFGALINVSASKAFFYIDDMTVKLYAGNGTLIDDLADNPGSTPGSIFVGQGTYIPGDYYFEVKGNVTGATGGMYTFVTNTAPVPEPETYAMLMAGLGVMGAIAVRRKKAKND